jgi:site-specific DNA recombinase
MNAIGYLRVSTPGQVEDGVSLDAQEAKVRAWAIAAGAESVKMFRDEGISGKRADNRPGFQAALEAVRRGDALIAYSLSRVSRSTRDTLDIAEALQRKGADLVSLTEKIDTTSASGKMVFRLLAVLAEFERDQISDRTKSALHYKRMRNEKTGGDVPFGYTVRHGRLIPKASEYPAVQDILRRRRRGESLQRIASALERQGVRRKEGGSTWYPVAVARVLRAESMRNACSQAL